MVGLSLGILSQLTHNHFPLIHKTTLLTAAALYLTSTLIALFTTSHHAVVALPRLVLYNAALLLALAETLRIFRNWHLQTRITLGVFVVEALGYCGLALAAATQDTYNSGACFMVASFLVSVAKETGIVLMLLPRAKIGVRRYQLLGYLSSCCSALLFFFGALLEDFMGSDSGRVIIGGLNVGSGVLLWASTLYTLKAEHYQGYRNMKQVGVE